MDNEKRTVLVAALSAYAELLTENATQLDLEKGKGKGKQADDDVDVAAELQTQINICGELSSRITSATCGSDIARIFEVVCPEPWGALEDIAEKSPTENRNETTNSWGNDSSRNFYTQNTQISPKSYQAYAIKEEPYINPFTGLPVITETGFEAGPSNSSLPPLRTAPEPPWMSLKSLPKRSEPSPGPPMRPTSKPLHLRARPIISPKPTLTTSATSPPQRPAPPPPPLTSPEIQELEQVLPQLDDRLIQVEDGIEKVVEADQYAGIPSSLDWEAGIEDVRGAVPRHEDEVKIPTHKNKYLRYIAELATKAMKATESMRSTTRAPPVYQPLSLNTGYMDNRPVELPAELPGYSFNGQPGLSFPRRESQESMPPAYDALSDIGQRQSIASNSSASGSRVWSLSSALSSRTSLSPSSPSTSSSPDLHYDSTQTSRRASYAGSNSNPKLFKTRSRVATPQIATALQRSMSSSALPNMAPGLKKGRTQSATDLSTQNTNPYLMTGGNASPLEEIQEGQLGRRQATSQVSNWRPGSGKFADGHMAADCVLTKGLSLSNSRPRILKSSSAKLPKLPSIRDNRAQRSIYTKSLRSPNKKSDQVAYDEALARSLQLEEEIELQMERDMLLAYKVANGTADDGDRDVAYFMYQESAKLVESTPMDPAIMTQTSSDLWGLDPDTQKQQIDWLEAHELNKTLGGHSSADEASFLEAKRLQAQYDQEVEAWEEWKGTNIEKCTSCLEDHPREELVRVCEHGYCNGCLDDGFKAALESRAPFKCCKKALQIKDCIGLPAEFVTDYEEMMLELSTPNPMFCSNAKCAKFLPPRAIVGDVGVCKKCATKTCRHCRKAVHPGTFCAEDKETEAVKKLAKEKGWKTCPGCNHLIERRDGCLHMVCSRCQTAFCYRCSKPWRDCESTCPDAISATHPKI